MNLLPKPTDDSLRPGLRPRLGFVVPAGSLLDYEYWELAGSNAAVYFARTELIEGGMVRDRELRLGDPDIVAPAVARVLAVSPDVVSFACTSASFVGGVERERQICETMLNVGAPAATTTSGALVGALRALGVTRIAIATPYDQALTEHLTAYLSDTGFAVTGLSTMGLMDPAEVVHLDTKDVAHMTRSADTPETEAVFLSCTNLPTLSALPALNQQLGKPVLASNQVTVWGALMAAGWENLATEILNPSSSSS